MRRKGRKVIKPAGSELMDYLNKGYAICNKCGAVMDRKEDPEGGCDIYACPSCGWEIEELDYEYESADEMELGLDERGYGPTAISYELEISINTIKSYIRRHPSMKNASRCLYCGKVISQTKGRKVKKFCSDRCRSAYWNYKYRKGGNPIGKGRPQA